MSVQTTSTLGDLGKRGLGPKFEAVFEQNMVQYVGKDAASKCFSFLNMEDPVKRTTGLAGYELPEYFGEGQPYPSTSNIKTAETLYTARNYGRSVEVTENCVKDREKLGAKLDEMANLAYKVDMFEVKAAFQILVGGSGTGQTSNGVYIDRYNSAALFQASHARADGGTAQSNQSAGAIALTETNLETGRLALVKQLTDRGLPLVDLGRIALCVPDDLEKNGIIYTKTTDRPSTANNDLNFYNGVIDLLSSRWLNSENGGSSTAWYLMAKLPGMDSLLRVYRYGAPMFAERPEDPKTGNMTFAYKQELAVGYSHWLGTWYSAGA